MVDTGEVRDTLRSRVANNENCALHIRDLLSKEVGGLPREKAETAIRKEAKTILEELLEKQDSIHCLLMEATEIIQNRILNILK